LIFPNNNRNTEADFSSLAMHSDKQSQRGFTNLLWAESLTTNPFASPQQSAQPPIQRGRIVLRFLAVLLWVAVGILAASTALALTTPEMNDRFERAPALFVTIVIVGLGLPLIGISLLGLSLWRRSRWPAIAGVAAFLPLVLMLLAIVVRNALRQ
jgi:hypothetical protein